LSMGVAVTFVTAAASLVTYLVQLVLKAYGIEYLQTIAFILVIAALVQFVEAVIKRKSIALYRALGIYLPLITTNCVVLGVTLVNVKEGFSFIETVVNGFAVGLGFTLALMLMSGIRERLETADIPKSLRGLPIVFICAALLALAFLGFSGMSV